jgi:hypothetical protein
MVVSVMGDITWGRSYKVELARDPTTGVTTVRVELPTDAWGKKLGRPQWNYD